MRKVICVAVCLLCLLLQPNRAYAASATDVCNYIETDGFIISAYDVQLDSAEIQEMTDTELYDLILLHSDPEAWNIQSGLPVDDSELAINFSEFKRDADPTGYPVVISAPILDGKASNITFRVYVKDASASPMPTPVPTPGPSSVPTPEPTMDAEPDFEDPLVPDNQGDTAQPWNNVSTAAIAPTPDAPPPESTPVPEQAKEQEQEQAPVLADMDDTDIEEVMEQTDLIAGIVIISEVTATGVLGVGIVSDLRLLRWYAKKKMRK